MEARPPVWQRVLVLGHRLLHVTESAQAELAYNRARRDAWLAWTLRWKERQAESGQTESPAPRATGANNC